MDVDALRADLVAVSVPDDAEPMAAYMKHRFVFLGVKTPARRAASRTTISSSRRADIDDVVEFAHRLRDQPEREFHYVASDVLRANETRLRADHLDDLRALVERDAWWDTVDALASPTIGTMVRRHPELGRTMDAWIEDPGIWLARVAILHQLRYGAATDADRLFGYARRRAADPEFFIRKAIGWALRQYARTEPDEVSRFVRDHSHELSSLTVREATRHLA